MRFMIVQEAGRHKANQEYRESLSMARALEELGVEVIVRGKGYSGEYEQDVDVILILENYDRTGWVPTFEHSRALKLFWSIDSHRCFDSHVRYATKHRINLILCSCKNDVPRFQEHGFDSVWFPNCYDSKLVHPINGISKIHPVGFCGNVVNRRSWLEFLEKNVTGFKKDIFVIGHGMVKAVNSYKIHVNKSVGQDLNYRVFETMGCGTCLLTDRVPGIENLFIDGVPLLLYDSNADMVEKIKWLLENQEAREAIAWRAYKIASTFHTYDERAKTLRGLVAKRLVA